MSPRAPSRRMVLVAGAATAAAAAGLPGLRGLARNRRRREAFARIFGEAVAASPAGRAFLSDYGQAVATGQRPDGIGAMAAAFLSASSIVAHLETGEPLDYAGLYDPYLTPCGDRLTAFWAPVDEHG